MCNVVEKRLHLYWKHLTWEPLVEYEHINLCVWGIVLIIYFVSLSTLH